MKKIFQVKVNPDSSQWIFPSDPLLRTLDFYRFDGTSRSKNWASPTYFVHKPKQPRSNFFTTFPGSFAFDDRVLSHSRLLGFFEMAGEILPIRLETGERLYILNVTEVVNALDRNKTSYDRLTGGISRFCFHVDRLSSSTLFKIPDVDHILTIVGVRGDSIDEFKNAYERSGFSGLEFVEIWSEGERL